MIFHFYSYIFFRRMRISWISAKKAKENVKFSKGTALNSAFLDVATYIPSSGLLVTDSHTPCNVGTQIKRKGEWYEERL